MNISPDYPTLTNMAPLTGWTYTDPTQSSQAFFYNGYNNGCPVAGDPNTRINPTSTFNWGNANPYSTPYGYQQPAPQQVQTPVQPFSAYGGSGQQPQSTMPTLNSFAIDRQPIQQPTFNQPVQQTPATPTPAPVYPPVYGNYNPNAPLFNANIPTFDRRTECWNNQFVQPQQIPVPNINWNQPAVQQPMVNPMYSFQCNPSFNQPSQTFQTSWMDTLRANQAVTY